MEVAGGCAIVTGGSSGIGKNIAKLLARRGANVFLVARKEETLKAAVEEVRKEARDPSQRFGCFGADVADPDAVKEAVSNAEAECGPSMVLVNSAGFVNPGYVEELPLSSMETELKVNYLGTVSAKDPETQTLTVQTEYYQWQFGGSGWEGCAYVLESRAPNQDAWETMSLPASTARTPMIAAAWRSPTRWLFSIISSWAECLRKGRFRTAASTPPRTV